MRQSEIVHLALMVAALGAAYLLPFELLLLSYAILGPAHYFTEISWLHDRGYFLPHRIWAAALAAVAFGTMLIASSYWLGIVLWIAFLASAILAAADTGRRIAAYAAVAVALTLVMLLSDIPFAIVGVLLPTFVHVCLFTLVFMTLGALRTNRGPQFALIGIYLVAIGVILAIPPGTNSVIPAFARIGRENFGGVAPALGSLFGIPGLTFPGRVTGLLSFVYTYHYLNWFIKADVIKWTAIPRPRLIAIAILSAASTALYFYNYEIGILVLLLASMLHVLLEFPLNTISIRQLGAAALRYKPS